MRKKLTDEQTEKCQKVYKQLNELRFYRKALKQNIPVSVLETSDPVMKETQLKYYKASVEKHKFDTEYLRETMEELNPGDYADLKLEYDTDQWEGRDDEFIDLDEDIKPTCKKEGIGIKKYDSYTDILKFNDPKIAEFFSK